jgi:hypothetical protein
MQHGATMQRQVSLIPEFSLYEGTCRNRATHELLT